MDLRSIREHRDRVLALAVDDMAEGLMIVHARTLQYVYVNRTAARLYGLDRDEMLRLGPGRAADWEGSAPGALGAICARLESLPAGGERQESVVRRIDELIAFLRIAVPLLALDSPEGIDFW